MFTLGEIDGESLTFAISVVMLILAIAGGVWKLSAVIGAAALRSERQGAKLDKGIATLAHNVSSLDGTVGELKATVGHLDERLGDHGERIVRLEERAGVARDGS